MVFRNSVRQGCALACAAALTAGCVSDAPAPAEPRASSHVHASLSVAETARLNQQIAELRRTTAAFHNPQKASEAGYTANFGCVDERAAGLPAEVARGMGDHITIADASGNFPLLGDNRVELLQPEFLVYGRQPGSGELKLAGFDYFIPASATWPSPENGGVPPTLLGMPMRWSPAFNGWMFHIWAWWHNPDGITVDFNPSVPLCECQVSPTSPICSG
jgi:hypothetical protein